MRLVGIMKFKRFLHKYPIFFKFNRMAFRLFFAQVRLLEFSDVRNTAGGV